MVFNATFNNISVILWQSVLLVEETGVPGENHRPVASHWQTLSHNVVSSTLRHDTGFELTTLVVIGTDCIGSCKSNYHMITATTAPNNRYRYRQSVNQLYFVVSFQYLGCSWVWMGKSAEILLGEGTRWIVSQTVYRRVWLWLRVHGFKW
jgi:hypothetical protein